MPVIEREHRARTGSASLGWFIVMMLICGFGIAATSAFAAHATVQPGFERPPANWFEAQVGLQLPIRIVVIHILGNVPIIATLIATVAALSYAGSRFVASISHARYALLVLLAAQLFVGLALACVPVAISSDTYAYMLLGHLWGIHGINPYASLNLYVHAAGDPGLNRLVGLFGNPIPFRDEYGPLFTYWAAAVAKLCAGMLRWEYVAYRVGAVAATVAISGCLFRMLRTRADVPRDIGRFAFNPLVLLETAINGHNDILMVAFAVAAFAFAEDLPVVAGILIGASIAVKLVSLVVLPFVVAMAARRGLQRSLLLLIPTLTVVVLCFLPFWVGTHTIGGIGKTGALFFSPTYLVGALLFGPNVEARIGAAPVAALHGVPVLGHASWLQLINLCLLAFFGLTATVLFVRFVRLRAVDELWKALVAFVWSSGFFNPWYFVWLTPIVAWRGPWPDYVQGMTCAALLYYPLLYGVANGNSREDAIALGVTFAVYIIPGIIVFTRSRFTSSNPSGLREARPKFSDL